MCLELIREGDPVAKKDHRCIWCGETILKGEKHHQQVGRFDGEIQDGRFHRECWTVASESFKDECEFTLWGHERGTLMPR